MHRFVAVVFAVIASLAGATAHASIIHFTTTMNGAGEAPPTPSTGTGIASLDFDTVLRTLFIQASFTGLSTPTVASHIHCCTALPGAGTALVATTAPSFQGFPLGVTSGTFTTTLDLNLLSSYNPAFVAQHGGTVATAAADLLAGMLAGTSYFNIHTTTFPGGEIRGFLLALPEPWTVGLMGVGLVAIGWSSRRRSAR